jgi:hypothetical protein
VNLWRRICLPTNRAAWERLLPSEQRRLALTDALLLSILGSIWTFVQARFHDVTMLMHSRQRWR